MADTHFEKPSLKSLRDRACSEYDARTKTGTSRLRHSMTNTLATIDAAATDEILRYIDWVAKQIHIPTADEEALNNHGYTWGVKRKMASFATGSAIFTGTPGTIIPISTKIRRPDGLTYVTTEAGEIDEDGSATVKIKATTTGKAGNVDNAIAFKLVSPVDGINADAVATEKGLTGGAETETNQRYAERIIEKIRRPSLGGAVEDYEAWAKEVPGVTRAWATKNEMGPGTVTVRFMMDDSYEDGIPREDDIDRVSAYLNDEVRHPFGATVFVVAPVAIPIAVKFANLNPDKVSRRQSVKDAIRKYLLSFERPGLKIYVSQIDAAVNSIPDIVSFTRLAPEADIQLGAGEIPVRGEVSFDD